MSSFWFPAYGNPAGQSNCPWFETTDDGWAYRTEHHPDGTSGSPLFRVMDDHAYAMVGHPADEEPLFEIIGSFAYVPGVAGPWYKIH